MHHTIHRLCRFEVVGTDCVDVLVEVVAPVERAPGTSGRGSCEIDAHHENDRFEVSEIPRVARVQRKSRGGGGGSDE